MTEVLDNNPTVIEEGSSNKIFDIFTKYNKIIAGSLVELVLLGGVYYYYSTSTNNSTNSITDLSESIGDEETIDSDNNLNNNVEEEDNDNDEDDIDDDNEDNGDGIVDFNLEDVESI